MLSDTLILLSIITSCVYFAFKNKYDDFNNESYVKSRVKRLLRRYGNRTKPNRKGHNKAD
jgi:hypothetical protein